MSDTRLNLIKTANIQYNEKERLYDTIRRNVSVIAEEHNTTADVLVENVTHILANIASTAEEGAPLKLMHINSIAAFMAGVESLAKALPTSQDRVKVQNALRYLQASKVGPDGFVTTAVAPIAQLGARKPGLMSKYDQLIKDYIVSQSRGQPNGGQLAQAAKQLQMLIDQAMRTASSTTASPRSSAPAGPAAPDTPTPHQ